ncbi:hypothetical protein CTI12_AA553810 [Artemisia annua]|uniref:Uncharacterized protein n=1 Tax=Artemisia annua TaxID=35608 RepID=A0A2U1KX76_ARTAN|nr:hypothetical protein CTI12_AA553810 [Artemisia annua]
MANTNSFYQERKRKSLDEPTIYAWFFSVIGVSAVIGAAFFPVPILRPACLFIIRSLWALRVLAILIIAGHVGQSIYAWRLAKRVDPANARWWAFQTFVLGFLSSKLLLKKAKQ